MRTNFSPMAEAARRLAASAASSKPGGTGSTPPMEPRWCEWPRRTPVSQARPGIWQTLQQIQRRHA